MTNMVSFMTDRASVIVQLYQDYKKFSKTATYINIQACMPSLLADGFRQLKSEETN